MSLVGVRGHQLFPVQPVTLTSRYSGWLAAAFLLATSAALARGKVQSVAGPALVVDADTLTINQHSIRLDGIDAPEKSQNCLKNGQSWPCGREAALALKKWIAGRDVSCVGSNFDRYGRLLARCTVKGQNVGSWLVSSGWAFAYRKYSDDFVPHENLARQTSKGLWSGRFLFPWTWRECQKNLAAPVCSLESIVAAPHSRVRTPPTTNSLDVPSREKTPNAASEPFPSCSAARAAGQAPLRRGMSGYSKRLDRDGDGIACE